MSTFSRTPAGISNYSSFFGCDFVVFTEGKPSEQPGPGSEERPDIQYYREVLSIASHGLCPKIKCIGNKTAALAYAEQIEAHNLHKSIVIVDKDLEGITCSPIPLRSVVRSKGYSWENELWSHSVISEVASQISNSNSLVTCLVNKNIPLLLKRTKYMSLLSITSSLHGCGILKSGNQSGGVGFKIPELPVSEVKRIRAIFNSTKASSCSICREIIRESSRVHGKEIIQGHLWEKIAICLISHAYKKATGESFPPKGLLRRLALSVLRKDVFAAIGKDITLHYRTELERLGIIAI